MSTSRQVDLSSLNKVLDISVLENLPCSSEARGFLKRIADAVAPILLRRRWQVPLLSEFIPDDPALQGMNVGGGQKILLRLRPASFPSSFLDYDQVLGVMLHELAHIVRGPHDAQFYAALDELQAEMAALPLAAAGTAAFATAGVALGGGAGAGDKRAACAA